MIEKDLDINEIANRAIDGETAGASKQSREQIAGYGRYLRETDPAAWRAFEQNQKLKQLANKPQKSVEQKGE